MDIPSANGARHVSRRKLGLSVFDCQAAIGYADTPVRKQFVSTEL